MEHSKIDNFSDAFLATRSTIGGNEFAKEWSDLVVELKGLLEDAGPNDGRAGSLDDLRKQVSYGGSYIRSFFMGKPSEDQQILLGTGEYTAAEGKVTFLTNGKLGEKAAAFKFLRHFYLLRARGGHRVWICSIPNSYGNWPHAELSGKTADGMRPRLTDVDERFSLEAKKHLSNATQEGLKWCHKVAIVLTAAARGKGTEQANALELVKRWFADETTTEAEVLTMVGTLAAGFKKITAVINSGQLILTDHPAYRGSQWESSEAFVTAGSKRDRLNVVYVEGAFFRTDQLLSGLAHWTRILIHELTHREAGTVDVPGRYAWGGIKPKSGSFPAAKAITNADSWAWFCADAAGALTESNRNDALK